MKTTDATYNYYSNSWRERVSLPCLVLCIVFFLVLGVLPVLPDRLVKMLKPVFIVSCLIFSGRGYYRLGYEKWLILLLAYLFIILATNAETNKSALSSYFSMLLFAIFFFFAGLRVWSEREIQLVFLTVVLSCAISAVILLYSNRGLLHSSGNQHINFLSVTLNRNTCAFAVVPGVICCAFMFFFSDKKAIVRIFYAALFLLCFYTLVALSCRSAFLSASTGVFLVVWEAAGVNAISGKVLARRLGVVLIILLLMWIAMNVLSGTNSYRLFDYSESGRDDIWRTAVEMIKKKPVFGGGFGYWESGGYRMSTHNTFLSIALISGYVGAAILIVMIFAMALECFRAQSVVAFAFSMEMLFHSISESGLDYYAYIPMILTTIILRYSEYQHRNLSSVFNLRSLRQG